MVRYVSPVLSYLHSVISELIFQKMATEINVFVDFSKDIFFIAFPIEFYISK